MYGHDPLLVFLSLALVAAFVGWIKHRFPAIGDAVDLACKAVLALIGVLVFVFVTSQAPETDTKDTAPQSPATPDTAEASPTHAHPSSTPTPRP
ncbi:hypothetical protein [Streptomyces galbus]|uniref:Uncharacterized protein n=1 Tax=Streptomyces galbus TaxID=33898 RepID=A0ABX1ISE6_STRGB|nr:hypothetical protein [Streptomyces galbus]NKQ28290.1 hypothetical protein [Streptomyces galbus]